jgi:hypothetical protein
MKAVDLVSNTRWSENTTVLNADGTFAYRPN